MSFFDMNEAGQIDQVGSYPPVPVSDKASALGPLDPDEGEVVPEGPAVIIDGGVDYQHRAVFALRLAQNVANGRPIHYWMEHDIFLQADRLADRKSWSKRNDELHTEYEINRINFDEFKESDVLVLDGIGARSGHYRFGEIEMLINLLYMRATRRDLHTIVNTITNLSEFNTHALYREAVAPLYERVTLKDNDLDTYAETSVIVVLEGVLADLTYTGRVRKRLRPATEWNWEQLALRRMVQWHRNNINVDVVTFVSEFAADSAAEFLIDYGYEFGLVEYRDFDLFCDALIVRRPTGVYDTEPRRLNRYGQFGVSTTKGTDFA